MQIVQYIPATKQRAGSLLAITPRREYQFVLSGRKLRCSFVRRLDNDAGFAWCPNVVRAKVPIDKVKAAMRADMRASRKFAVTLIEVREADGTLSEITGHAVSKNERYGFVICEGDRFFKITKSVPSETGGFLNAPVLDAPLGMSAAVGKALNELRAGKGKHWIFKKIEHRTDEPVDLSTHLTPANRPEAAIA